MSRETRVTLEGENKFKMAVLSAKSVRNRLWDGNKF